MEALALIIAALVAIFGIKKWVESNSDDKKQAEYKAADAELEKAQKDLEDGLRNMRKKVEERRKAMENMTPKEIEDYWNNEDN